jgi:sugar porter (SP) family MFS transporter
MTDNTSQRRSYNYRYLWLICLIATLGGFLFGYDWIVVGGAKEFYQAYFGISDDIAKGWGVSSALLGCIVGALGCYAYCDKLGRKRPLIVAGLLFTVSAIGTALADTFFWYNFFRIIGGLGIGIALNLSPMYIAEMSPPKIRGMMVSVNQVTIMVGILAAQVVNWQISLIDTQMPLDATPEIIAQHWNGQMGWRWMFAAEALPAVIFFILMFFVPESVRWLVKDGQHERAREILARLEGEDNADKELADIQSTISKEETGQVLFKDLLEPNLFKILLLGVFLSFFQQWCGLNAIFYYAADIFMAAGYNLKAMMLQIVVIGGVMVVSSIVTVLTVDRIGRKRLLLFGGISLIVFYLGITACFKLDYLGLPIVLLTLGCVAVYSLSLAPLLWVILSEIFPNRIRGAAMSIAATAHWVGNFILTLSFPTLITRLGMDNVFFVFVGVCLVGVLVVKKYLPETKGKSLEEIERHFGTSSE